MALAVDLPAAGLEHAADVGALHIVQTLEGTRIVRLEGWLEGEAVAELGRVLAGATGPLRLELSELRSADSAGIAALRALRASGATMIGASPYIRLLLGSSG